jgi:hypothetical protein
MFPDDSLQSLIQPSDWWIKNENKTLCRGALLFSFAPHIDQIPYTFEPVGRSQATEHNSAIVRVSPLKVDQPLRQIDLPVAAMPLHDKEIWAAYRAKRRPCLVFGSESIPVDKALTRGKPNYATAPMFLAAPYYGVAQGEKRAGYSPEFVERVRHCEYPQFHWEKLPISGVDGSILRLDHLQPFGAHHDAYKLSDYMLSPDAMDLLDDLLRWLIWGGVTETSMILDYRKLIDTTFVGN